MKWQVKKSNDVFYYDDGCEGFREFLVVTNGDRTFKSEEEGDLQWLCDFLNQHDKDEPCPKSS